MSDKILRMLIIDDEASQIHEDTMMDVMRAMGVAAEIVYVPNDEHAQHQISIWAKQGYKANIISHDLYDRALYFRGQYGFVGDQSLIDLLQYIEDRYGLDFIPDRFYVHSADPRGPLDTKWGQLVMIDRMEYDDMKDLEECTSTYPRLRRYLNENWGTSYPLSAEAARLLSSKDMKIKADECSQLLHEGAFSAEDILKRLDTSNPADFRDRSRVHKPSESEYIDIDDNGKVIQLPIPPDIQAEIDLGNDDYYIPTFNDAVPGICTGYLALNAEDIDYLRKERPNEKIILVLETAKDLHLLSSVDAVCILKNDEVAQHLKIIAENHGLPTLIGADRGTARIEDNGFYWKSDWGSKDREEILFAARAAVTIETRQGYDSIRGEHESGSIYVGTRKIISFPACRELNEMAPYADTLRREKSRISIKANIDSPQQLKRAIENGAEAAGLIRTEHMFFEPQSLELLRAALTATDGQRTLFLGALQLLHQQNLTALLMAAQDSPRPFPLTIRLMDPPPEEFLTVAQQSQLEERTGVRNIRGTQLALATPGLYEMQIRALTAAMDKIQYEGSVTVIAPTIRTEEEVKILRALVKDAYPQKPLGFGIMMENQKAFEDRDDLLPYCEAVCVGMNDLTCDIMGGIRRNDVIAIDDWMNTHNHKGKSPLLTLSVPVQSHIFNLVDSLHRLKLQDKISVTLCGQQVSKDYNSLKLAAQYDLSVSVPSGSLMYARMVTAQIIQAQEDKPSPAPKQRKPRQKKPAP